MCWYSVCLALCVLCGDKPVEDCGCNTPRRAQEDAHAGHVESPGHKYSERANKEFMNIEDTLSKVHTHTHTHSVSAPVFNLLDNISTSPVAVLLSPVCVCVDGSAAGRMVPDGNR